MFKINVVNEFPPKAFYRSLVNLEFLYGIYAFLLFFSVKLAITLPKVSKDWLIIPASLIYSSVYFSLPSEALYTLSEPAKSTIYN